MTTETIRAEDMPFTITHKGREFFLTRWTGTTLDACPFGPGHQCFEYWEVDQDDNVRLYAISPTQFWSNDV